MLDMSVNNRANLSGVTSSPLKLQTVAPTQKPIETADEAMKKTVNVLMDGTKALANEMKAALEIKKTNEEIKKAKEELNSLPARMGSFNAEVERMSNEEFNQRAGDSVADIQKLFEESEVPDFSNWEREINGDGITISRSTLCGGEIFCENITHNATGRHVRKLYQDGKLTTIGYNDMCKEFYVGNPELEGDQFAYYHFKNTATNSDPTVFLKYQKTDEGMEYSATATKSVRVDIKSAEGKV